jgi:redox-sensitive bicupin YhaK (pirin superfamily)
MIMIDRPPRGEGFAPFILPEQHEDPTMTYIETIEEPVIRSTPPRQAAPLKIGRNAKRRHGSGGFGIEILHPGLARGKRDSGIGTIGRIDDASVAPGTLVAMHPHRDDEIITYLRSGRVMHKDTVGETEWVTPARLMLMKAGREFQHEELVDPAGGQLRALQIFLRPSVGGLEPEVQFYDFVKPVSHGKWRRIAGPEADAALRVRSRSWVEDARFAKGEAVAFPIAPVEEATRLLYVFEGRVRVDGVELAMGESAILSAPAESLETLEDSDLVLLSTDESAPIFKGGMFSGNMIA